MTKTKELIIELISDLCVSDGQGYNSYVDTDVCYDEFGFPYIPARRIRGCLRECAQELNDWGESNICIEQMFGKGGTKQNDSIIKISNAVLEDYEIKLSIVKKNRDHMIVHPQNILNLYSYIRYQTAIDYESGIADDNSLRSMRVINRGLQFVAEIEYEEEMEGNIENCCAILRHMGIARTRGLGEVRVSLGKTLDKSERGKEDYKPSADNTIWYSMRLIDPVIFKSVAGGETHTQDYIEGSKMLGLIAQWFKENDEGEGSFRSFMGEGKLICSNAYISIDGKRGEEVPGYLYSIKNNDSECINKLYQTNEENGESEDNKGDSNKKGKEETSEQLNRFKHCYVSYVSDGLVKKSVQTEEHYHHRRPEDKSIGRAVSDGDVDSNFYTMESIQSGQEFIGYIRGNSNQMKKVAEILGSKDRFRIGYSKNTEYGRVEVNPINLSEEIINSEKKNKTKMLVVTLLSPTLVYNGDRAKMSTSVEDLVEEILVDQPDSVKEFFEGRKMGEVDIESCMDLYLNYTSVGGYNTTWGMRKPVNPAFDKGTTVVVHFDEEKEINEGVFWIGERNSEGYGECKVFSVDDSSYSKARGNIHKEDAKTYEQNKIDIEDNDEFLKKICDRLFLNYLDEKAVEMAKKDCGSKESFKSTISNMLSMCKECDTIGDVKKGHDSKGTVRYEIWKRFGEKNSARKIEKYNVAKEILKDVDDRFSDDECNEMTSNDSKNVLADFMTTYYIENYKPDVNKMKMKLLTSYLTHLKYKLRDEKGE